MEKEKITALALFFKKGFGYKRFKELLKKHGSLSCGVKEEKIELGSELKRAEEELKKAEKLGVKLLTPLDKEYPRELLNLSQPPLALYLKGNLFKPPRVAVVGSRRCSDYGRRVAFRLGKFLSERGIPVVSGLALGIDSQAHKGAVAGGGKTVAVLGSSLDCPYPETNKELFLKVVQSGGGVISELPFGTRAKRAFFPRRNRIVAALSDVLVVVEAREKSGTSITVNFALELGKDVVAVPGNIDSPFSKGTNRLLLEGALPLTSIEDFFSLFPNLKPVREKEVSIPKGGEIYSLLKEEPLSSDEIAFRLKVPVSKVNSILSLLEVKGLVRREGLKWTAL